MKGVTTRKILCVCIMLDISRTLGDSPSQLSVMLADVAVAGLGTGIEPLEIALLNLPSFLKYRRTVVDTD